MAKVIRMLEKMGLVTMEGEPQPRAVSASEPEPESEASRLAIEPGPPPVVVEELPPERFAESLDADQMPSSPDQYPFDRIFASAGVTVPEHGFTVYKLMEMMEAEEFRDVDPVTTARVIAGMLRHLPTGPVEVDDIVRDAALRDQALDAFEQFLADRFTSSARELEEANRALQEEIDELVRRNTEMMEANRARIADEEGHLERWRARKRAEEDRLYAAVQPFVEANPVTRSESD